MKTINLCGRTGGCCPKLAVHTKGNKTTFVVTDDYGGEVKLKADEARNFALEVLREVGK